ncbi:hypothetical protein EWM64_g9862 [Hericium alpestre]|uniref:Homeobox domain-containing protein n=1 Tax=Hericium alpestre TaxID=135208 RepID=A0A4Y9ZIZ8_9AGAM|nr:hypothetical protein EWM64_g9862 [Hericium alpestre]
MTDTLPSRSYIPSLIPPGVDPSVVDSTMFQNYIPGAVKTRKRTSPSQLRVLEDIFTRDKKPASSLRQELANQLDMTQREVQVWFQNRRAKDKKIREKSNKEHAKPSASPFKEEDDDSDAELKSSSPRRPPLSSPLAVPLSPNDTSNTLHAPRASLPHSSMTPSLNVDTESAYPAPPHPPPSHPTSARSSFSVSPVTGTAFVSNDAFLLDHTAADGHRALYVWVGRDASLTERRLALQYAQGYLQGLKEKGEEVSLGCSVVRMNEGAESEEFVRVRESL